MGKIYYGNEGSNDTGFNTKKNEKNEALSMADNIQGAAQKNLFMFQIVALVMTAIAVFCVIAMGIANMKERIVPIVVTVNGEGEQQYVGRVDKSLFKTKGYIPENAKTYQIKKLLHHMFTVVVDKSAQQGYIQESLALVQKGAVTQLDSFYRNNNPFDDFGNYVQVVDIKEPLKQTERTYLTNISVTRKTKDGYTVRIEDYTVLTNLEFFDSAPESNPLGIYVVNFDIKAN